MNTVLKKQAPCCAGSGLVSAPKSTYRLAAAAMAMALSLFPLGQAAADTYPSKAVTLVAPFAAGGSTDMLARVIAKSLAKELNQSVVVENRGGAGGTIGAATVAKAKADGYTLLLTNVTLTSADALYKGLPYDFQRDFDHVSMLAQVPCVLLINKDLPVKDVKEFLAYLKANPGKLNYGSSGVGAALHLATQSFLSAANAEALHIPYKGTGPMMVDLMAGNVQFAIDTSGSASAQIRADKVRGIAVTTKERDPSYPDLPSLAEVGIPFDMSIWYGIATPAGLPKDVEQTLYKALVNTVNSEEVRQAYKSMGAQADTTGGEAFAKKVGDDKIRWTKIIQDAGIEPS